jgi:hypothetical protein
VRRPGGSSGSIHGRHLREFHQGLLAKRRLAVLYFDAALKKQPSFDRARLALWDVCTEQGDYARAGGSQPVSSASPLARRAQFLAGLSQVHLNTPTRSARSMLSPIRSQRARAEQSRRHPAATRLRA